jgi:ammonia channel protein AmtB
MKTEDIYAGIILGIIFVCVGFSMAFKTKITSALLESNKAFWTKMIGYTPNEKFSTSLAHIMIPLMGVVFMAAGIASIIKVIMHFLN